MKELTNTEKNLQMKQKTAVSSDTTAPIGTTVHKAFCYIKTTKCG
jgi:hypothetical protein